MLGDLSSVCEADAPPITVLDRQRNARSQQQVRWACSGLILMTFAAFFVFHWHWWQSATKSQQARQRMMLSPVLSAPILPAHSNGFLDAADRDLVHRVRLKDPSRSDPLAAVQAFRSLQTALEADWQGQLGTPHEVRGRGRKHLASRSHDLHTARAPTWGQLKAAYGKIAVHQASRSSQGAQQSFQRRLHQAAVSDELPEELLGLERGLDVVSKLPLDHARLMSQASSLMAAANLIDCMDTDPGLGAWRHYQHACKCISMAAACK